MKKLLLVSLLAIGATSFAAVQGTATEANVGITVRGNVFTPAGELVVTPSQNISPDGRAMVFDLGDIAVGTTSVPVEGRFTVERLNMNNGNLANQPLVDATHTLSANLVKTTQNITTGATGTTVNYNLAFMPVDGSVAGNTAVTSAEGTLAVSAVAGDVAGNILDTNELRIRITQN